MSNYSKVVLKNSTVAGAVPIPSFLDDGEVALNHADGALYFKDSSDEIRRFESVYTLKMSEDLSAPSTAAVQSTESVTLPPGIYKYSGILYATTASATSGIGAEIILSDYTTSSIEHKIGYTANGDDVTDLSTIAENKITLGPESIGSISKSANALGGTAVTVFNGQLDTLSDDLTTIINFQVRQITASDASNPTAIRAASSYVQFSKIG